MMKAAHFLFLLVAISSLSLAQSRPAIPSNYSATGPEPCKTAPTELARNAIHILRVEAISTQPTDGTYADEGYGQGEFDTVKLLEVLKSTIHWDSGHVFRVHPFPGKHTGQDNFAPEHLTGGNRYYLVYRYHLDEEPNGKNDLIGLVRCGVLQDIPVVRTHLLEGIVQGTSRRIADEQSVAVQSRWTLPKLQELTEAEAIGRNSFQLSNEESILLKDLTRKIIQECIDDPGPGDPPTTVGTFRRMRVRRVTLTPKGDSGLVVQGFGVCMCGAVGNCPFWLIDERQHPRLLLHEIGIQSFAFQKPQTGDHFDLVLGSHDSAMVTDLQRFRFDDSGYRPDGCASLEWDDTNGNALNPPRVTVERCP